MKRFWSQLTTRDFEALDPARTVAVLPIAAIEQHGPHLPVSTDTAIAEGHVAEVVARLPDEASVLFLPVLAYGKSDEHLSFPGTLTLSAETLIAVITEIGASVARAGLKKLIVINSHGGNVEVMGIAARRLRTEHQLFVVATNWLRFGQPEGLYSEGELRLGIHGGDIETSLMLHFRGDEVQMEKAENFVSLSAAMENDYQKLRATGPVSFAWLTEDLHPSGAIGDAAAATMEKGARSAAHAAEGFIALLRDVARFPVESLSGKS